jgi:hypothetical protein
VDMFHKKYNLRNKEKKIYKRKEREKHVTKNT